MTHAASANLPYDLARQIGAIPELIGTDDGPEPQTQLGWVLYWVKKHHLPLFPCKSWVGIPITSKWYRDATCSLPKLVEWWSETPDADIAAVPELSGHYVLAAVGNRGLVSLEALEERHGDLSPEFTTENRWGDLHLWFKGRALTSHNLLGPGLHVYGPGTFVYMPASLAPDNDWE